MKNQTLLERVSGNLGTTIGATLIASSGGTYLAPLLPTLFGALANGRYKKRVQAALEEIEDRLSKQEEIVKNISDNQFKLVSEIASTIFRTTNNDKINFLKEAAVNGISEDAVEDHEVSMISRVLRDISVMELLFLKRISGYKEIIIATENGGVSNKNDASLWIVAESTDAELLSGLVNLGIVVGTASGYGGTLNYRFHPLAAKIVDLVSAKHGA